jgi:protein TonB
MGIKKICFLGLFILGSLVTFGQPDPILPDPPPPPVPLEEEPLVVYEISPEYPGGNEAIFKDIIKNLQYPQFCIDAGVEGKVFIQFIVEKNGKISNPKVLRQPEGDCGKAMAQEAIRAIRLLKDFTPAMQNGRTVRAYMTLPIVFKLN